MSSALLIPSAWSRLRALLLFFCMVAATPALAELLEGVVEFQGAAPPATKLRRESDRFCAQTTRFDQSVQVRGNRLKDVWVHVVKGAPDQPGSPDKTVAIKQAECMYEPHVTALQAGNRLTIENSDPVLHNVHAWAGGSTLFNRAMPGPGVIRFDSTTPQSTAKWSGLLRWKCDVHAWMTGYLGVSRNPYFAVSDADGAFRIENLPPGRYSLAAWHEKFGEKTVDLSIEPGQAAKIVIRFGQKLAQLSTH